MVRAAFVAICLVNAATLSAQERATTESGRRLLIYPDGTWKPAPAAILPSGDHTRPAAATERISTRRGAMQACTTIPPSALRRRAQSRAAILSPM